eukprot:g11146.t1
MIQHPLFESTMTIIVALNVSGKEGLQEVRALRVTRVVPPAAGAPRDPAPRGVVTPPPVAGAGSEPSDPRRPLARSPRPAAEAREGERSGAAASALEPPEAEEETSGESEESGSGSEVTTIGPGVTPVTTTGLAAKARPEARPSKEVDEVAKEEVEEARDDGREADKASLWDVTLDILQMCNLAGDAESIAGITGLKVFRFIRVTRILKTIQFVRILRFFMALRTLVTSIFSTVKSLVWALLLLGLIVYIFAVIFVQVVNDYMDSAHSVTEEVQSLSQRHFSSLTSCMLSLFMSIAGGVSWQEVLEPVKEVSTWWVFLFLFFISFTEFAVLNVVTGVFCQSAIESASHDQAHMMQSMMQNKETHLNKIKDLFAKMGAHESGCITFSMFEDKINDPDVRAFFESLDLDIWDAWTFFKLLDTDGGGMVEVEEFFMGCLRFRGTARSMDVAKLIQDQRWLIHHLSSFEAFMESELNCVKAPLVQLGQSVRPSYKKILPRLGSRMRDLDTTRPKKRRRLLARSPRAGLVSRVSLPRIWLLPEEISRPVRSVALLSRASLEQLPVPLDPDEAVGAASSSLLRQHHAAVMQRLDLQDDLLHQVLSSCSHTAPKLLLNYSDDSFARSEGNNGQAAAASSFPKVVGSSQATLLSSYTHEEPRGGSSHHATVMRMKGTARFPWCWQDLQQKDDALQAHSEHSRKLFKNRTPNAKRMRDDSCAQKLVKLQSFEAFFALVVITNAIFIGFDACNARRITGQSTEDVFIVASSLWEVMVDIVTDILNGQGNLESVAGLSNVKSFRVIRLTRLLKTAQFIRIFRFVMALRMLVTSIISTLKALLWALVLLMLIVYVFAVLFTQAVHEWKEDPCLRSAYMWIQGT